jgi:hypothetical protein
MSANKLINIFNNKWVKIGIAGVFAIFSFYLSFRQVPFTKVDANMYDEQMWTSSSISSYNMFCKGYVRPTKELDNWFPTYAWRNHLDIFTGEKWEQFSPDTIKFPYDYITVKEPKTQYTLLVKYDTTKFSRNKFQWFDREMWTFGWKAPNFAKYVMGWYINLRSTIKPDPRGYFKFFVPKSLNDSIDKSYIPSLQPSPAPYSYAPENYQLLAREPNAFANAITIMVVFLIGWLFLNYWVGFVSALWLLANKTYIYINCLVGLDSFATFFTTLTVLMLLFQIKSLLKNDPWWKILLWGLSTGLVAGLAVSSKLNSAIILFAEGLTLGILGVITLWKAFKLKEQNTRTRWSPVFKIGASGILSVICTIWLFIYLNPQVRKDPMTSVKVMRQSIDEYFDRRARIFVTDQFTNRLKAMNAAILEQSKTSGANQPQLMQLNNQMNGLYQEFISNVNQNKLDENKFYLTRSDKFFTRLEKIEKEVEASTSYDRSKFTYYNWVKIKNQWPEACKIVMQRLAIRDSDRYYGTFGSILPFKYNFMDGLFAIIGLVFCLLITWKGWRKTKEFSTYLIVCLCFALVFYGNVDFLWQDWARYITPIFPLYALMIGVGIVHLIQFIVSKILQKKVVVSEKQMEPSNNKGKKNTGKK